MKFLVDANVLSEPTKMNPRAQVLEWLEENESELAVDPVILGEIRLGIFLLPAGAHRRKLERWFVDVVQTIHCMPWESDTGVRWAKLAADLRTAGHSIPVRDSLIAASALSRNLMLVTRNTKDFEKTGVRLLNPFLLP